MVQLFQLNGKISFFVLHDTYLLSSCYGGVYRPTCKLTCEEDRASVSPA